MCWFQGGSDLPGAVASAGVVTTEAIVCLAAHEAIVCLAAHKARAWPPPREDCTRTVLSAWSTHRSRHVELALLIPADDRKMLARGTGTRRPIGRWRVVVFLREWQPWPQSPA